MKVLKDVSLERSVEDDSARKVSFTLSTAAVDRDGDTIDPKGWELDAYRSNPVVLWHHDTTVPPIAKSESIEVVDGKLRAIAVFPPKGVHPFADTVYELVKGGWVNAASVGFNGKERQPRADKGFDYKRQELYEWSILPVPSHREALRDAAKSGVDFQPVIKWLAVHAGDDVVTKAFAEAVPAPPSQPGATTDTGDHAGAGTAVVAIGKYIREVDGKFCVFSKDGKRLGCHDTKPEAESQLAAIEANKRSPEDWSRIIIGWLTTQPVITPEMLELACPACATKMRSKGIKSFLLKPGYSLKDAVKDIFKEIPGAGRPEAFAGLCDKFGDVDGFHERCVSHMDMLDNPEAFCAALKDYCHGTEWRHEEAASAGTTKLPVAESEPIVYGPGGKQLTGVVSVPELLRAMEDERDKSEARWQLEDALRTALASIDAFEKDPQRKRELVSQAAADFASRYEATKEADEMNRLAKELFGGGNPPPAPGAPPAEGEPPKPGEGEDDGSGIAAIDEAYDKLWADVKAAIAEQDPQAKANALKAALEAFAQVVMEAKPEAPATPPPAPPAAPPGAQTMGVHDLIEKVGRVLSGKNEARLRAALDALSEILSTLPQLPDQVAFVDGDSTTPDRNGPKALSDEVVKEFAAGLDAPQGGDDLDKLLRTELGMSKDDVRDGIARAVKEAFTQARTAVHDGRLPD